MLLREPRWIQSLQGQPETGMGFQSVTITLRDGRRFRRVRVVGGRLTGETPWEPPFLEQDIVDLRVTHDRSGPPVEEA